MGDGLLSSFLKTTAPLPWRAVLDDGDRWGLTVVCGDGKNLSDRTMTRDEARFICAVSAMSARALAYVEEMADRGGKEAASIMEDFKKQAFYDLTPEQRVRARREWEEKKDERLHDH